MWYNILVLYASTKILCFVKAAWVEIPQLVTISGTNKTEFVFAPPPTAAHVPEQIEITTIDYKTLMTTAKIPTLTTAQSMNKANKTKKMYAIPDQIKQRSDTFSNDSLHLNEVDDSTYSGILPILNTIQEKLTSKSRKSLQSKILLLRSLRDNLLENIYERITNMWSKPVEETLEARGYEQHEMEFPSNEGALMTIGFLTFAVFLIKLVLKLIHALKEKHNALSMATMGGTTMTTIIGRKRRSLEEYDNLKILQLIDEYNFR